MKPPKDKRIQKTETLLRDALISLVQEKSYNSIVVKEILERANVGRTAFYTHFQDKDDLLASSIHEILRAARSAETPASAKPYERIIRFSLPIFEYVQQHRHEHQRVNDREMNPESRRTLHTRLQEVLVDSIKDDVERYLRGHRTPNVQVPPTILVSYLACTFVLVLDWWVETESMLDAKQVNELFRALVLPTMVTTLRGDPAAIRP